MREYNVHDPRWLGSDDGRDGAIKPRAVERETQRTARIKSAWVQVQSSCLQGYDLAAQLVLIAPGDVRRAAAAALDELVLKTLAGATTLARLEPMSQSCERSPGASIPSWQAG